MEEVELPCSSSVPALVHLRHTLPFDPTTQNSRVLNRHDGENVVHVSRNSDYLACPSNPVSDAVIMCTKPSQGSRNSDTKGNSTPENESAVQGAGVNSNIPLASLETKCLLDMTS